jgi:subtilase family serine protease
MRKPVPVAAAGLALGLAVAFGISTTANAEANRALAGSVPSWATSATKQGDAPATDRVGFRVYLGWQNADALTQLATAVSTPGSASYRQFLTPQQFRARFAPSQTDLSAVQKWLRDSGFTVDYTPQNGHYVAAEGTVAQAQAAFGAKIGLYQKNGLVLHSPESALSVPARLTAVTAVAGLDDSAALVTHSAPPSPAFVNAPPCSAFWAEKTTTNTATTDGTVVPGNYPYAPCGYLPNQLQGAYGVASAVAAGNNGSGQTVAVIDAYASPTILADVNEYSTRHGLPTFHNGQFQDISAPGTFKRPESGARNPHGPVQDPQGWYGEETLDVEAVHSIAPGANILYVGAPNNYQDLDAALNHVVDQRLATIVTNSYGFSSEALPPGFIQPYLDTMLQGVVTGIGIYFSSGDNGDETGGDPANAAAATPDWPASSPFVTAVGGTSLAVGASNQYLFETGWETGRSVLVNGAFTTPVYQYGSGGGTSRLFAQPAYQAGVVPGAIATVHGGAPARVVPDIAALGDPNTGMRVGQTQTFPDGSVRYSEYRIGGTSLSSPLFAGFMALVQQRAGHVIGFANPLIYSKAGSSAYHDVIAPAAPLAVVRADYINGVDATDGLRYTLRSLNFDSGLTIHTRPGYDAVTGVGTPNGAAFLAALSS